MRGTTADVLIMWRAEDVPCSLSREVVVIVCQFGYICVGGCGWPIHSRMMWMETAACTYTILCVGRAPTFLCLNIQVHLVMPHNQGIESFASSFLPLGAACCDAM